MSIESYIHTLRGKPEHVRKQIAFWSALSITLVIFVFWIASFTLVSKTATQAVASAVEKAGSPAQSLTASVSGLFSDIKDLIFTPRKVTFTDIEVEPGK